MGNPAGVRRDLQALGYRRLRAARLLAEGIHQSEVARRVGVLARRSAELRAHFSTTISIRGEIKIRYAVGSVVVQRIHWAPTVRLQLAELSWAHRLRI